LSDVLVNAVDPQPGNDDEQDDCHTPASHWFVSQSVEQAPENYFRQLNDNQTIAANEWFRSTDLCRSVILGSLARLDIYRLPTLQEQNDAWQAFRTAISQLWTECLNTQHDPRTIDGGVLNGCEKIRGHLRNLLGANSDTTRAEASNSAATAASAAQWRMSRETLHPRAKEMHQAFEEYENARQFVYRTGSLRRISSEIFCLLSGAGHERRRVIAQVSSGCFARHLWMKNAHDDRSSLESRILIEASTDEIRHIIAIALECETPLEHLAVAGSYRVFEFI
jgi:hypothetical protein